MVGHHEYGAGDGAVCAGVCGGAADHGAGEGDACAGAVAE